MSYIEGDTPDSIVIELADLTDETVTAASLRVGSSTHNGTIAGGDVTFSLPALTKLGVIRSTIRLTRPGGSSFSVAGPSFVVEPSVPSGWHTLASARDEWRDAPSEHETGGDVLLYTVLETARVQCAEFGPSLAVDEAPTLPGLGTLSGADTLPSAGTLAVPEHFRQAQLMQARNIWNASRTDPASGGIGNDGFVIRPFPMDWVVKGILRPKRGIPVFA
ncbi:hypothetical protein [Agromyces atrinae]|uniref:Uncharacterized protein n=1 Tax=Agromyces atrinae TaxID=592376 RepID=A0A4Q2MB81_9MICO|nr:hypothetical protein [Agromyces atrinae]NYD65988.1 hypothetical protein [Agromyces atrinae]RXZ86320.1 hypothetical protein ESP50_11220 [Agromyces atrinae]